MAALANLLVKDGAFRGELGIHRRQNRIRPLRRIQSGEAGLRIRRFSGQKLFNLVNRLNPNAGRKQRNVSTGEVHGGTHAQRFARIARHRLLDRAVVLHPLEPRSVPDVREMDWRRVSGEIRGIVAEVHGKYEIADAGQRVQPRVAFFHGLGLDAFFQIVNLKDFRCHLHELRFQLRFRRWAGPEPRTRSANRSNRMGE